MDCYTGNDKNHLYEYMKAGTIRGGSTPTKNTTTMIRELLQARDGQLDISMSPCEVRTLLEYVCTM